MAGTAESDVTLGEAVEDAAGQVDLADAPAKRH